MKIIEKYKNMSLPVKASLWFMICSIIQKGISFITTPIFTRMLSTQEYGVVSIFNSWQGIIEIFATLELFTGVYNKAMIKYKDRRDAYTSSTLVLSSICCLACFTIYILNAKMWNSLTELETPYMIMMFVDIFFSTALTFYTIRNRFEYKYRSAVLITVGTNILGVLSSIFCVYYFPQAKAEAKVFGVVIVHLIIYAIVYIYILVKGRALYEKEYWNYSFKYNLTLVPHYLAQQVLNQSDRVMISKICGTAEAGIYAVAYQIAIVMNILIGAIQSSFTPWTYEKLSKKETKDIGNVAVKIEIAVGILCVWFSMLAPELVHILGGDEYMSAIWIVPPVAISVVFNVMYSFFVNIELYYEKTNYVTVATVIVAFINIGLNAFFIKYWGFIAAGYTTLFCYVLYSLFHYIVMKKICKQNEVENPYSGLKMGIIAMLFLVIMLGCMSLYNSFILRYVIFIIILVAILIVTVLFGKKFRKIRK